MAEQGSGRAALTPFSAVPTKDFIIKMLLDHVDEPRGPSPMREALGEAAGCRRRAAGRESPGPTGDGV